MHIEIKRGLDVDIAGAPVQGIGDTENTPTIGIVGADYPAVKPALSIAEGDTVACGQTLFTDARRPEIRITSPVSGEIAAIHRGAKRRLVSIVIASGGHDRMALPSAVAARERSSGPAIRELLLESGLWAAIRARPFDAIADPASEPQALLINAADTSPHAVDPAVVIDDKAEAFQRGVAALGLLSEKTMLCTPAGLAIDQAQLGTVEHITVAGPHPAGLTGTLIRFLTSPTTQPDIWHIGYQDAIALGELLITGELPAERVVSIAGPGASRPRIVRTQLGASILELSNGATSDGLHVLSGSPLGGRPVAPNAEFLGRYDTQIAVLGGPRGVAGAPSDSRRAGNARSSGMLSVEAFDRVWPFAGPPVPLLRALLARDVNRSHELGCLALGAEDLALCSYVCPANIDYGAALRDVLDELGAGR